MASFKGHLTFSSMLAAGYASAAVWQWKLDWGPAFLGGGLTMMGGMLPDLDSDSGIPVRELFGLAAATVPLLLVGRLRNDFTPDQSLVIMAGIYLAIRYLLSWLFKRHTVHRGMFHSIPAMFIAGLGAFLLYHNPDMTTRLFLAGGVTLGFLSHLVLDEIYAVDLMGVQIRLNKFAGSALKLVSDSYFATALTYLILAGLVYLTMLDWTKQNGQALPIPRLTARAALP